MQSWKYARKTKVNEVNEVKVISYRGTTCLQIEIYV